MGSEYQPFKPGMLQQQDRLGIDDAAVGDHGEGFGGIDLEHLDILAFMLGTATMRNAIGGRIFGNEAIEPLGDAAGAHIGREDEARPADAIAQFLFRLLADAGLGILLVEKPGARFDQQLAIARDPGRHAELADQEHASALPDHREGSRRHGRDHRPA